MNLLSWFNLETNGILLAVGDELIYLLLGKGKRVAHLHTGMGIVLEILNLSTLSFQLLWSIESDICLTIVQKLLIFPNIEQKSIFSPINSFLQCENTKKKLL